MAQAGSGGTNRPGFLAPDPVPSHPRLCRCLRGIFLKLPAGGSGTHRGGGVTPDCAHYNFSHHTAYLQESSSTPACSLGLVGVFPGNRVEKSPTRSSPALSRELGALMQLCGLCVCSPVPFSSRKKSQERDLGVDCLHVTPQILASTPRFLINVILIGFRSLETTK